MCASQHASSCPWSDALDLLHAASTGCPIVLPENCPKACNAPSAARYMHFKNCTCTWQPDGLAVGAPPRAVPAGCEDQLVPSNSEAHSAVLTQIQPCLSPKGRRRVRKALCCAYLLHVLCLHVHECKSSPHSWRIVQLYTDAERAATPLCCSPWVRR